MIPKDVHGRSAFELFIASGETPSPMQAIAQKLFGRERATLVGAELKAAKSLAGVGFLGRLPVEPRTFVACCGRRSGKTVRLLAPWTLAECLRRDWSKVLARGETGRALIIAPTLALTRTALDAVAGLCVALGIPQERREGVVDLRRAGLPIVIEATPADLVSPRGSSLICVAVDEAGFLRFDDDAVAKDTAIRAAYLAGLASTNGRELVISTGFTRAGLFHDLVSKGTNKTTVVVTAPTWVMHPALTEERCRELAPDERTFQIEFAAGFGEPESAAYDSREVAARFERGVVEHAPRPEVQYVAALDASGGRSGGDAFFYMVGHREMRAREGQPPELVIVVDLIRRFAAAKGEPRLDLERVLAVIAGANKRYGNPPIARDGFSGDLVEAFMAQRGVRTQEISMAPLAQMKRFDLLGQLIRTGTISIVEHDVTEKELCSLRVRMRSGGRLEYAAKRGHDDACDCIAALAEAAQGAAPSGGTIESETRVSFGIEEGISISTTWFATRPAAGGGYLRVPIVPPLGTPEGDQALAERQARGQEAPGDPPLPRGRAGMSINVRNE